MKKEQLEKLVEEGYSIRKIAKETKKGYSTIRYWLNHYELKTTPRRSPYLCKTCGESNPNNFYQRRKSECRFCSVEKDKKRLKSYKQLSVEYKGGKCAICNYNKSIEALQFHHLDPKKKDPNYTSMKNWSFESKKKELDKCILVCANCHAEIHANMTS